eukprot:gene3619-7200_t
MLKSDSKDDHGDPDTALKGPRSTSPRVMRFKNSNAELSEDKRDQNVDQEEGGRGDKRSSSPRAVRFSKNDNHPEEETVNPGDRTKNSDSGRERKSISPRQARALNIDQSNQHSEGGPSNIVKSKPPPGQKPWMKGRPAKGTNSVEEKVEDVIVVQNKKPTSSSNAGMGKEETVVDIPDTEKSQTDKGDDDGNTDDDGVRNKQRSISPRQARVLKINTVISDEVVVEEDEGVVGIGSSADVGEGNASKEGTDTKSLADTLIGTETDTGPKDIDITNITTDSNSKNKNSKTDNVSKNNTSNNSSSSNNNNEYYIEEKGDTNDICGGSSSINNTPNPLTDKTNNSTPTSTKNKNSTTTSPSVEVDVEEAEETDGSMERMKSQSQSSSSFTSSTPIKLAVTLLEGAEFTAINSSSSNNNINDNMDVVAVKDPSTSNMDLCISLNIEDIWGAETSKYSINNGIISWALDTITTTTNDNTIDNTIDNSEGILQQDLDHQHEVDIKNISLLSDAREVSGKIRIIITNQEKINVISKNRKNFKIDIENEDENKDDDNSDNDNYKSNLVITKKSKISKSIPEIFLLIKDNLVRNYETVEIGRAKLIQAFESIDPNLSRQIDLSEFTRVLRTVGITSIDPLEVEVLFMECSNGDGDLDYMIWIESLGLNRPLVDLIERLQFILKRIIEMKLKINKEKLLNEFTINFYNLNTTNTTTSTTNKDKNSTNVLLHDFDIVINSLGIGFNQQEIEILYKNCCNSTISKMNILRILTEKDNNDNDDNEYIDDEIDIKKVKILSFADKFMNLLYIDGISNVGGRSASFLLEEIRQHISRLGGIESTTVQSLLVSKDITSTSSTRNTKTILKNNSKDNKDINKVISSTISQEQFCKFIKLLGMNTNMTVEEGKRLWRHITRTRTMTMTGDTVEARGRGASAAPLTLTHFLMKIIHVLLTEDSSNGKEGVQIDDEEESKINSTANNSTATGRGLLRRRRIHRPMDGGGKPMIPPDKAATVIKAAYRGMKCRRYLRLLGYFAVIIQRRVRGKIARREFLQKQKRLRFRKEAEKQRIERLRAIRCKERELLVLQAMPVEDFMDFHRLQQESSAKAVQRVWRSYKAKKNGIKLKLDANMRGSWGDAISGMKRALALEEHAKKQKETEEKAKKNALLSRMQKGLDIAGIPADLPARGYEPEALSLAHTLRQIKEAAARRTKEYQKQRERSIRMQQPTDRDRDANANMSNMNISMEYGNGNGISFMGKDLDQIISRRVAATEKLSKIQTLAEIQNAREDIVEEYLDCHDFISANQQSRKQTVSRCQELIKLLTNPPTLEESKLIFNLNLNTSNIKTTSTTRSLSGSGSGTKEREVSVPIDIDEKLNPWRRAMGTKIRHGSDNTPFIEISRYGLPDAIDAHLRTVSVLKDKSKWSVVAAPHDIAGPPIDLLQLDTAATSTTHTKTKTTATRSTSRTGGGSGVGRGTGNGVSLLEEREEALHESENTSLWWVAYCAQPPRYSNITSTTAESDKKTASASVIVPPKKKTNIEIQHELAMEQSKKAAKEMLGEVDGEQLLARLAHNEALGGLKRHMAIEDSIQRDRDRVNRRALQVQKEVLRLRLLRQQESGRLATSQEEQLRRFVAARKIQTLCRGKVARQQLKVMQAQKRVAEALRLLVSELSSPELRGTGTGTGTGTGNEIDATLRRILGGSRDMISSKLHPLRSSKISTNSNSNTNTNALKNIISLNAVSNQNQNNPQYPSSSVMIHSGDTIKQSAYHTIISKSTDKSQQDMSSSMAASIIQRSFRSRTASTLNFSFDNGTSSSNNNNIATKNQSERNTIGDQRSNMSVMSPQLSHITPSNQKHRHHPVDTELAEGTGLQRYMSSSPSSHNKKTSLSLSPSHRSRKSKGLNQLSSFDNDNDDYGGDDSPSSPLAMTFLRDIDLDRVRGSGNRGSDDAGYISPPAIDTVPVADSIHAMAKVTDATFTSISTSSVVLEMIASISDVSIANFKKAPAFSLLRQISMTCGPVPLYKWFKQHAIPTTSTTTSTSSSTVDVRYIPYITAGKMLGELASVLGLLGASAGRIDGELYQLMTLLWILAGRGSGSGSGSGKRLKDREQKVINVRELCNLCEDQWLSVAVQGADGNRIRRLLAVCRYTLMNEAAKTATTPVAVFQSLLDKRNITTTTASTTVTVTVATTTTTTTCLSIPQLCSIFSHLNLNLNGDEAHAIIMYVAWDSVVDTVSDMRDMEDVLCRGVPTSFRGIQMHVQSLLQMLPEVVSDIYSVLKISPATTTTNTTNASSSPSKGKLNRDESPSRSLLQSQSPHSGKKGNINTLNSSVTSLASIEEDYDKYFITEDRFCDAVRVTVQLPLSYSEIYILARLLSRYPTDDKTSGGGSNSAVNKGSPLKSSTAASPSTSSARSRVIDIRVLQSIRRGEYVNASLLS